MLKRRGCSLAVTARLRVAASPSAVTTSGFHSPHRLHVHCPQARPPEAGFVSMLLLREAPACGAPGRKTSCSQRLVSSQRDRTGRALGIVAWPRGLPARQVLGGEGGWVEIRCGLFPPAVPWFGVSISLFPLPRRPAGGSAHSGSLHARSGRGTRGMCFGSSTDPPPTSGGTVWPTRHLVFKHFYICGSS